MAKPSVTNTKPPSQTTLWQPARTEWDLNDGAHVAEATALNSYGEEGVAPYASLTGSINQTPFGLLGAAFEDFDYVFFGVNGGYDETVKGKTDASGVIVTGNGKDNITGGVEGDLVFSGNGKDVVHGGAGSDIIFGENGADQLWGDADDGSASQGSGQVLVTLVPKKADGTLEAGNGGPTPSPNDPPDTYADNMGSLQKAGVYVDGGEYFQMFSYDPGDHAPLNLLNTVHIYVYVYESGFQNPTFLGDWTVAENQQVYFAVNLNDNSDGGQVAVFVGPPTQAQIDNPQGQSADKTQAFNELSTVVSEGEFTFEAGDQLVGGNGPDEFHYALGDGVDLVWDYNQGAGVLDATEGDVLVLHGITGADYTVEMFDLDGDTVDDVVLYFDVDQAIGFVGIHDVADLTISYVA